MKIIVSLCLLLMCSISTKAQIINFTDPDFKEYLVNYPTYVTSGSIIDTNTDGEIQVSEAFNFGFTNASLSIFSHNISDFTGLEYFTTITNLFIQGNTMTSLNLSALNLEGFGLSYNTSLQASNIIFSSPLFLKGITLNNCNLGAFDLGLNYTRIEILTLRNSHITSLNVRGCTALEALYCDGNELTTLDVSGLAMIEAITCSQNLLTNINLNGTGTNGFGGFSLYCTLNKFTQLDVSEAAVNSLTCKQNQFLETVILGDNFTQTQLDCSFCPALTYINMKNGEIVPTSLISINCPNLRFVCVDPWEETTIKNYYAANAMNYVSVSPYCSFFPGGEIGSSWGMISGYIRYDNDANGCTPADPVASFATIRADGLFSNTSATVTPDPVTGYYAFIMNTDSYNITPVFENSGNFAFSQPVPTIQINQTQPTAVQDLCIIPNGNHPDLEIVLIPTDARPGFNVSYQLVYKNKGTLIQSGSVQLDFDDARLNFIAANPTVFSQTTGSLTWNFSNLLPFEVRTIDLEFLVLAPPVNNIDDQLIFTSTVSPVSGDDTPEDNVFTYNQIITGSYDPNEKICLQGKYINAADIDKYVHYVVNFQNLGTDTAFNIVIRDSISNKYQKNSLQLLASSHPCTLKMDNTSNKIEFIFENIKLPAQVTNDPESKGYVVFKLLPVTTINFRDSLINGANIYFDYNLPVRTENAITIIDSAGTLVPITMEYFRGWKQGNKNMLSWKAICSFGQSRFNIERSSNGREFTEIGNITASDTRCIQPFSFTDDQPKSGINYYRLRMNDPEGKITYSIIIALLNNEKDFELVSLLPNPVVNNYALLNISSAKSQVLRIQISDTYGRIVQSLSKQVPSGSNQLTIMLETLSAGMYNITVNSNDGIRQSLRFIKK